MSATLTVAPDGYEFSGSQYDLDAMQAAASVVWRMVPEARRAQELEDVLAVEATGLVRLKTRVEGDEEILTLSFEPPMPSMLVAAAHVIQFVYLTRTEDASAEWLDGAS